MKYRLQLSDNKLRIRKFLDILGCMKPFSDLTDRERDIFAEYVNGYYELIKRFDEKQTYSILFGYDFIKEISDKLSTKKKNVSMDLVRNYTSILRKKGLLVDKSIHENFIKLFNILDKEITFVLEIKN